MKKISKEEFEKQIKTLGFIPIFEDGLSFYHGDHVTVIFQGVLDADFLLRKNNDIKLDYSCTIEALKKDLDKLRYRKEN